MAYLIAYQTRNSRLLRIYTRVSNDLPKKIVYLSSRRVDDFLGERTIVIASFEIAARYECALPTIRVDAFNYRGDVTRTVDLTTVL